LYCNKQINLTSAQQVFYYLLTEMGNIESIDYYKDKIRKLYGLIEKTYIESKMKCSIEHIINTRE
jgi:hypothetical protein